LTGVGEADSRSGAEAEALAALARIFQVRIETQTAQWQKYLQVESNGRSRIEQNQSIALLTKASTDRVIEGAEIVEVAQQKSRYYALAVIDRSQAKNRLTEQIQQLDADVAQAVDLARAGSVKLIRIRNYKNAIKMLMLREALNTDLTIVNPVGEGVPPRISTGDAVQEFVAWLDKDFLIHVQMTGRESVVIQKAVIDALIENHLPHPFPLPVGEGGRRPGEGRGEGMGEGRSEKVPPDLIVTGEVAFTPIRLSQPFQYVRWCVDLVVHETEQDRIIGVAALSGREGHLSNTEAEARAMQSLLPKVTEAIGGIIARYFSDEFKLITDRPLSCVKGG